MDGGASEQEWRGEGAQGGEGRRVEEARRRARAVHAGAHGDRRGEAPDAAARGRGPREAEPRAEHDGRVARRLPRAARGPLRAAERPGLREAAPVHRRRRARQGALLRAHLRRARGAVLRARAGAPGAAPRPGPGRLHGVGGVQGRGLRGRRDGRVQLLPPPLRGARRAARPGVARREPDARDDARGHAVPARALRRAPALGDGGAAPHVLRVRLPAQPPRAHRRGDAAPVALRAARGAARRLPPARRGDGGALQDEHDAQGPAAPHAVAQREGRRRDELGAREGALPAGPAHLLGRRLRGVLPRADPRHLRLARAAPAQLPRDRQQGGDPRGRVLRRPAPREAARVRAAPARRQPHAARGAPPEDHGHGEPPRAGPPGGRGAGRRRRRRPAATGRGRGPAVRRRGPRARPRAAQREAREEEAPPALSSALPPPLPPDPRPRVH
mmetsp:Transcript_8868/g.28166  ORF Transcript_8868/g.28166 Transcript_8868/m.28166 type:complete len:444 (-) Transcript_8868:19-1350(-)